MRMDSRTTTKPYNSKMELKSTMMEFYRFVGFTNEEMGYLYGLQSNASIMSGCNQPISATIPQDIEVLHAVNTLAANKRGRMMLLILELSTEAPL